MKHWLTLITTLLVLALAGPALAQGSATPIAYGETAQGEITNAQFEVPYVFTGAANEIVVIYMVADGNDDFYEPSIILLDADNTVLASADGWYDVTLMTTLPAAGEYTVLASRNGGRTGDGVGAYSLSLDVLNTIALGEMLEAEMTNEDAVRYAVEVTGSFTVEFERVSGDFAPELTINVMDESGELNPVGTLQGSALRKVVVTIEPDSDVAPSLYVLQLQEGPWDWNFETVSVQYRLTVTQ